MAPNPRNSGMSNRIMNALILFSLSLLFTGIMFQRATNSVQQVETSAATANAMANNGGNLLSQYSSFIDRNMYPPLNSIGDSLRGLIKGEESTEFKKKARIEDRKSFILVEELLEKVTASLTYVAHLDKRVNRFDMVTNSEIHILLKLKKFLSQTVSSIKETPESAGDLTSLISKGYQCSSTERLQQQSIAQIISMDICSEIEWYKVVQLAWPEAKTFIDVGANKGYLGSLFLSLWGGG
eukprot:CAMPEP_0119046616 /NCGR_PEP_ID=MMETSP1177-20130426/47807_1 /TAXON_ID=2985 /ORGANISM="Ochromonas sp, Strain CCMP1899" /LENGTH=238 /DNA_ID=CAMNT_0007020017 /DNA_START=25 /DNA_END=737 /DNA_ORIENTATION=-